MKVRKRKSIRRGRKIIVKARTHKKKIAAPRKRQRRKENAMGEGKSLLGKIFNWGKKKEAPKKEPAQPPARKNEFAEDEKTIDGVARLLRSDLEKSSHKKK